MNEDNMNEDDFMEEVETEPGGIGRWIGKRVWPGLKVWQLAVAVLVILVLLVGCGVGGYFISHNQSYAQAYDEGYDEGYD